MTIPTSSPLVCAASPKTPFSRGASALPLLLLVSLLGAACEGDPVKLDDNTNTGPVTSPVDTADATVPDTVYDLDHDGYNSDVDCDDNDWSIHPDAGEICDGKDNDCDDQIDEGWDVDGDGHLPPECGGGDDCDDNNANINPSAVDIPYDGVDQDCSGSDNLDADGDGFDAIEAGGNDCDDESASTYPGAPEVAKDGVDQNCDGLDLLDGDGDGFDDDAFGGTDCDDSDPYIYPDGWEWMNDEVDSDCDGTDGRPVDMTDAEVIFSGTASSNDYFAYHIATCDFDNDGLQDLVISAPLADGNLGQVGIFLGSSHQDWSTSSAMDDADFVITGSDIGFGSGIACGDLDGDGMVDLVAASGEYYAYDTDFTMSVWYGASGWSSEMFQAEADAHLTVDLGVTSSQTSVYGLGFRLGDLDGDGNDDLFVDTSVGSELAGLGEPDNTLWLIPGGAWSGTYLASDVVTNRISPDTNGSLTGYEVVPDWNGDGKNELVLKQGEYTSDITGTEYVLGRASFISGWPSADGQVATLAFASVEGNNGFDSGFGYGTLVSDIDGDGATDMFGCAPYLPYSSRTNSGACYFYNDIATDITATGLVAANYADNSVLSGYQDGFFGAGADLVPDIDGDGMMEMLVVEPGGGTGSRGRTIILNGALTTGVGGLPDDVSMAEFSHVNNYSSVSDSRAVGDFDGDGVTDFVFGAVAYGRTSSGSGTYQGRTWVWLSSRYLVY